MLSNNTNKNGEELDTIYRTSFGVNVAVGRSDVNYYKLLHYLRQANVIDEFAFRTFEFHFFSSGYELVA